jgi:uncharacterized protein YdbL (DUF1318 family)
MKNKPFNLILSLLALALFCAPYSFAADEKKDPEMAALQKRFEQRFAQIKSLKAKGIIGETFGGYLDFVKEKDAPAASLVDDENADRKKLYELIAKKENTTATKVAERNARRNFEKAKPGEYLRGEDGSWHKKAGEGK